MIALCETKVSAKYNININGYETIKSNCKKGKEGLFIAIKEGTFLAADKISKSNEKNILTARVMYPECTMRFIVVHGPQENDDIEARNDFYESLMVEVERGKASDDNIILLGDMNARIERDETIKHLSSNGKHLKELMEKYQLDVLNFHTNTVGKWTRIQKQKGILKKSIIDYVLVEDNMKIRVEKVVEQYPFIVGISDT